MVPGTWYSYFIRELFNLVQRINIHTQYFIRELFNLVLVPVPGPDLCGMPKLCTRYMRRKAGEKKSALTACITS